MNKFSLIYKENRLTVWMLLFVLAFYGAAFIGGPAFQRKLGSSGTRASESMKPEELQQKEQSFEKNVLKMPGFVSAFSLAALLLIFAGIFLDVRFLLGVSKGRRWIADDLPHRSVLWGGRHVVTATVFLFFSEAALLTVEAFFLHGKGPSRISYDFVLMANSLFRDAAAAVFIVYFVTRRLGHKVSDLGLTSKDFFKNVGRGIVAYVAVIPPMLLTLLVLTWAVKIFSYEPPPQNVVQIFLKKSADPYLLFFTFFVAGVGPVIEEIFFRGFTYKAFRQKLGVLPAMVLTSAIFSAFHLNLLLSIPIFFLGMFLCYLYEETGSLVPSMTAHMLHNLLMVTFTLGYKSIAG